MRITLTVIEGPHQGQVFTFDGHDTFLVGRSKRAHFRLPSKDRYFSRIHFLVEVNPPHCRLMDMGSSNHTYVNEKQVERCDLRDGDMIRAGRTVLRVTVSETPATAPPPEAPAAFDRTHGAAPAAFDQTHGGASVPAPAPVGKAGDSGDVGFDDFGPELGPEEDSPVSAGPTARGASSYGPPAARDPFATPSTPGPADRRATELPADTRATDYDPGHTAQPGASPFPPYSRTAPSGRAPAVSRPPPGCAACGGPLPPPPPGEPPLCPACLSASRTQRQPIAAYQIVRELGRGSMGLVYLAVRRADGLPVALKTVIPASGGSDAQVQRFLREAEVLQQLSHPNIVAFRDMGESEGVLFFAMDYVRGQDAHKLLKKGGPFAPARAAALGVQLLDALAFAHSRGFVHRDVKPSNLLVTADGDRERLLVADFGLAKVYQASQLSGLTMTGDVGGTIPFMAPEQITEYREAKPPVDQYSAAATLYNLLTGAYVYDFPASFQNQLLTILNEDPVPLRRRRPEAPEGLAAAIHRALRREPVERFPDAGAFRDALRPYAR
jgi:serine/threonine-protein kinase